MSKIAFVFPGQGSQTVGMCKDLYDNYTCARKVFEAADEALGFSISDMCFNGPEDQLRLTFNTQPAILTASVACAEVLKENGLSCEVAAGHSLGEYSALVLAGALDFADAVRIVRKRGQFMQEAVPVGQGGMAAIIGLSDEVVAQVCQEASAQGVVEAVNFNSPGQVVIAGEKAAVEKACELAKAQGAKRALLLPVSAPFHSSLRNPASVALRAKLDETPMSAPEIDVVANVDVKVHKDKEAIIEALASQAAGAVQWVKTIQAFKEMGVTHIVECGPGRVLAGLIKRIDSSIVVKNINSQDSLVAVLEEINAAE